LERADGAEEDELREMWLRVATSWRQVRDGQTARYGPVDAAVCTQPPTDERPRDQLQALQIAQQDARQARRALAEHVSRLAAGSEEKDVASELEAELRRQSDRLATERIRAAEGMPGPLSLY